MNQRGGSFFTSNLDIFLDNKRELVSSLRHEEDVLNIWDWDVSLRLVLVDELDRPVSEAFR